MTPLDYAQQRGHSDCVRILQTYGLRRPLSAVSVHSHAGGLPPSSSQALDEHGHIVQHKPSRRFSLSGVSLSSIDRLPADGQAQSESTSEENASANEVDSSQQEGVEECIHYPCINISQFFFTNNGNNFIVVVGLRMFSLLCSQGEIVLT